MEIRDLRVFIAVVDEGSLSAAARRLHMSQPSLSQIIQALEKQLNGRLLERDNTGARPTERGSLLYTEAVGLVERHDRVVADILEMPTTATLPLRIGVPLELPPELLPTAISHVTRAHPDLVVQLHHSRSAAQLAALRSGDLDIALVRQRPTDTNIDSVLAVEEAMGVILTAERAEQLAEPPGVPLHKLADLRWVGFSRGDAPLWHDQVSATLRGHGVTRTDPAGDQDRPVTPEVKLAVAGTGQSFALASESWAQHLPQGLVWHPLVGDPVVRRTWAAWRSESRRREVAVLIAALDLNG